MTSSATGLARPGLPKRRDRGQSGQGMIEYALILILVSVVAVLIVLLLGGQVFNMFSDVVQGL